MNVFTVEYVIQENGVSKLEYRDCGILAVLSSSDIARTDKFIEKIREHALGWFDNYHDDMEGNYDWLLSKKLEWVFLITTA